MDDGVTAVHVANRIGMGVAVAELKELLWEEKTEEFVVVSKAELEAEVLAMEEVERPNESFGVSGNSGEAALEALAACVGVTTTSSNTG